MGETDTRGETRKGGGPSPLTHSGLLTLRPGVFVDTNTCRKTRWLEPGGRQGGFAAPTVCVAADHGSEKGSLPGAEEKGPAGLVSSLALQVQLGTPCLPGYLPL